MELQPALLKGLHGLSSSIDEKVHLLASKGHAGLSELALEVTKHLFDLGVTLEESSHASIHPFLASIAEPTPILLRSTKGKGKETSPARMEPENVLPHTPLSELTTSGLETEQIWEQLELRAPGYIKVAKEIISAGGRPPMDEDEEDMEKEEDEEDSEDDDDGEDLTEEEARQMFEDGELGDMTDEQFEEMMRKAEEESEDEDESDLSDDDDEDEEGDSLEGSDEDGEIEFEDGTKIGDSDEDLLDEDDDEDDEDDDEEDEEEEEEEEDDDIDMGSDEEPSFNDVEEEGDDQAGPSRRRRHPTLDDQFFSIDDFNRMTEEAEATSLSSGRLDDDEEEELDEDVGQLMLNGVGDDEGIMYTDFFDAPRTVEKPVGKSKKAKVMEPKGKKGKKGKGVTFDEEDQEEEVEDAREVMGRFKEDLFADDDDEEEVENDQPMSTFEKRQKALADQIAQYEQEAVGPKDWTLLGEASSRARPENSLLEEDLDFEHVRKATPVITEEVVKSLEELIKKRILDNDFNSTVRVRAYEPTPFLASRYFELQDKQSSKSLAEIYEEEYQSAQAGGKGVDPRDAKLKKDHQEIEDLWNDICYKLDALSSLNFVPKQPKAQITTISNLPTTSMETALPSTSSATTMLAPEELLNPATASSLVARSELTPEEAQHLRDRKRKAKKQDRKHLGDMAELYSKSKKGGAKGEKERALQGLVKSGKGVTVVGKSEKELGKSRKRGSGGDEAAREDGKRLKL